MSCVSGYCENTVLYSLYICYILTSFFLLLSKSLILQKQNTNTHALGNKMCRVVNLKMLRTVLPSMLPSIKIPALNPTYDKKEDPFCQEGIFQLHNICKSYDFCHRLCLSWVITFVKGCDSGQMYLTGVLMFYYLFKSDLNI